MNVREFQLYLGEMARFFEAAKATAVAKDFAAIRTGLEPFAEISLAKFAEFLPIAEDYFRRGELPGTVKPKALPKPRGSKSAPVDVDAVVRRVQDLYERAAHPNTEMAEIEATASELQKLKKPDLTRVAQSIDLTQKFKTNGDLIKGIVKLIKTRKDVVGRSSQ
jgi:hypothetical protein